MANISKDSVYQEFLDEMNRKRTYIENLQKEIEQNRKKIEDELILSNTWYSDDIVFELELIINLLEDMYDEVGRKITKLDESW